MNITSKIKNYWVTITVEEYENKVECDVSSLKEAEDLREELISVLEDLDIYIEKQQKKNIIN